MQAIFKTLRICNTLNRILHDWACDLDCCVFPTHPTVLTAKEVCHLTSTSKQNVMHYGKYISKSKYQVLTSNFANLTVQEETFTLHC